MPRPPENSHTRRFVEQAIMWIVLAGTLGLAATVNRELNRLGPVQEIGGIMLQLPAGWIPTDDDHDDQISLRERGDPDLARTITVRTETARFSISELLNAATRRAILEETVSLPDGTTAQIRVLRQGFQTRHGRYYELQTLGIVPTPDGRNVYITLEQISLGARSDIDAGTRLMRRILDTVKLD